MSPYWRILTYFRPYAWQTAWTTLASLVGVGFSLLKPWPLKIVIDQILPHFLYSKEEESWAEKIEIGFGIELGLKTAPLAVLILCVILLAIYGLSSLFQLISHYHFIQTSLQALLTFRTHLYDKLQSLPQRFHTAHTTSDSTYRITYDSQSIQTIFHKGFSEVISSLALLVGILIVMIQLDAKLTLYALGVLPLLVVVMLYYARQIRQQSSAYQESETGVLSTAQEGIAGIRIVQAYGQEKREVRRLARAAEQSNSTHATLTRTQITSNFWVALLMALGTALLVYIGSLHVMAGKIPLGTLFVFSTYLVMLYQPLEQLTYTAWALEGAAAQAQRCFEILDEKDESRDAPGALPLPKISGEIVFDHVHFRYPRGEKVLDGIDLHIPARSNVALVGSTGSGKTTLLSLIARFYDPTSGTITLDGHDLRQIQKHSLRQHIAILQQQTILFSTTILENIAYGRPDASRPEIVEAAKLAQAHDFVERLPGGYDAILGEKGIYLSIGQRQRIGMARAFLTNSPILLLDEPTSALDPTTESAVLHALHRLMTDRTTIVISHRLHKLFDFDFVVVLADGKIVEVGPPQQLLERGGAFSQLYHSESLG